MYFSIHFQLFNIFFSSEIILNSYTINTFTCMYVIQIGTRFFAMSKMLD